jgi:hypothetical protein
VGKTKASLSIQAKDFQNLEYAVYCRNTLTATRIDEPSRIKIIEFLDDGLILQLPRNICSEGHFLALSILPRPTNRTHVELIRSPEGADLIEITAKVKELEREEPLGDRAVIEFYQLNQVAWKLFMKSYTDRQKKLDRLLKAIRQ